MSRSHLKVAINAQLEFLTSGGGSTVLLGLIRALGQLDDGDETYTIIARPESAEFVRQVTGPNQRVVHKPEPQSSLWKRRITYRLKKYSQLLTRPFYTPGPPEPGWVPPPVSDGFYEGLGCDLIHFPYPEPVVCALPSIFQIYDLQHLHFPQYFQAVEIARRELAYPTGCHLAHTIIAGSDWCKQDVANRYRIAPEKMRVIWNGPPTHVTPSVTPLDALRRTYDIDTAFALFPAVVLPHKNHLRLLEALALLRDRHNLRVNIVCTGHKSDYYHQMVEPRLNELNLNKKVRFLGLVPFEDLRGLYAASDFLIFPTLFEGAGYPPMEAWNEGKPVCCSRVTSLPELVRDAALLFDPTSVEAMAAAIKRMVEDESLRETLSQRGQERLRDFEWNRVAREYRAIYRMVAGHPLSDEDQYLLNGVSGKGGETS